MVKESKSKKTKGLIRARKDKNMFNMKNEIKPIKNYNTPEFKETVDKILSENEKRLKYDFYDNYLTDDLKDIFQKPIGLHDLFGNNVNPFTMRPYEDIYTDVIGKYRAGVLKDKDYNTTYKNAAVNWSSLPMYDKLDNLIKLIRENQVTLLLSDTGSGKTVLTPRAAMEAFNYQKKVIITMPKKKICKDSANTTALWTSVKLGDEIGYYYKGDRKVNDKTKLFYTTAGSLISLITREDPYLSQYDCIIIDEAHERSVETDELLYFIKKALIKRKDLKLVIMSATIDLSLFRNYFPQGDPTNNNLENISKAKFKYGEIDVGGEKPRFKIDINFSQYPVNQMDWKKKAAEKVVEILKTTETGDIIVFITAAGDGNFICDEMKRLLKDVKDINPFCAHLSSGSKNEESNFTFGRKNLSLHPNYDESHPWTRKVVLSTNVAESSLTVPSIVYVVDSGYQYEESFDPFTNARSLVNARISKAQAKQRAGRAGRTMDGICFRLYTEDEFNKFHDYPIPDIRKQDLTSVSLDLMLLPYINSIGELKKKVFEELMEEPKKEFVVSAIDTLFAMGAIDKNSDDGKLTKLGRALSDFRALSIQSAKAIIASYYLNCKHDVMTILTLFMEIDERMEYLYGNEPRRRGMNNFEYEIAMKEYQKKTKQWNSEYGDFITLWNAYQAYRNYIYTEPRKTKEEARKWLKDNALAPHIFMKGDEIDNIASKVQMLNRTLMKIVQPPELKKKYFNELKAMDPMVKMSDIMSELKEAKINKKGFDPEMRLIMSDEDIELMKESNKTNKKYENMVNSVMNHMMLTGGYNAKPYEEVYFDNLVPLEDKIDNIIYSLTNGYITNFAKNINSSRMIYKACFPQVKIQCQFARDTSLTTKRAPSLVFYGEMMRLRADQKILKMNIVNRIPTVVMDKLKDIYPELIKEYTKLKNNSNSYSKLGKSDRKGKSKKSGKSRKSGKSKYRRR